MTRENTSSQLNVNSPKVGKQKKNKTPSGNNLQINYKDIRAIFSPPENLKVSEKARQLKVNQPEQQRLKATRISEHKGKTLIGKVVKRKTKVIKGKQQSESFNTQNDAFDQDQILTVIPT